jgi:hypothetical protein
MLSRLSLLRPLSPLKSEKMSDFILLRVNRLNGRNRQTVSFALLDLALGI